MEKQLKILTSVVLLLPILGCVDNITFESPEITRLMVVDGSITDDPGPYRITVTNIQKIGELGRDREPIINLTIELFDDLGNSEILQEIEPGIYETGGVIQGRIGGTYHIRIETQTGKIFESIPEKLNAVGQITDIRYEFEARTREGEFIDEVRADVFKVFFDAEDVVSEEVNYTRWRYTGTYLVTTFPEQNIVWLQGGGVNRISFPDPLPCSGYDRIFVNGNPTIVQFEECDCCQCWITDNENAPILSDGQLVANGQYNNIKAAEIPITPATFYDKYRVDIEQMSLTKNAFDYFGLIKDQRLQADDLFQPIPSELSGNIEAVNNNDLVVGLFWATSISREHMYINRDDVPYPLLPIESSTQACYDFYNKSTNIKPEFWDD